MVNIERTIEPRERITVPKNHPTNREPDFDPLYDDFSRRHIGPSIDEANHMLNQLSCKSMDEFISQCVPSSIRLQRELDIPEGLTEAALLQRARNLAHKNKAAKSFIGTGYYNTFTPTVIQRNILENPAWYTAYTPYQAEISQGRMEALLNFQTIISDLTGLPIANASLLDEGTAAAEAVAMCLAYQKNPKPSVFVDQNIFPQTLEVLRSRMEPLGVEIFLGDIQKIPSTQKFFAIYLQYCGDNGAIADLTKIIAHAKAQQIHTIVGCDLLSLCVLKSPGELGADVAIGSAQRFGVSMGFGGPHAAFLSTKEEFKRLIPGRIIGVSKDVDGQPAYRLSLQTREQHIRREKATSNICTAQVLLAVMASMYAVYHGPKGLKAIADRVQRMTSALAQSLKKLGFQLKSESVFDTLHVITGAQTQKILEFAQLKNINLRKVNKDCIGISCDEATVEQDLEDILQAFLLGQKLPFSVYEQIDIAPTTIPSEAMRTSAYLTHKIFNSLHTESELLRYIFSLQNKDVSLVHSMIPLGSCTMKLNATSEMMAVTWPKFANAHPFAPLNQVEGYMEMIHELERWLAEITGFPGISLQPNAGSQGEYAGLLAIRAHYKEKGQSHRNICLIPSSAHGTNPASAVMAGMKVIVVACDSDGNIDVGDLKTKATENRNDLAALMVTYPSTHGVFEETIKEICQIVHDNGGQVYMDGANMNAMVGLSQPALVGADVCHLNLHKTFCIPHGGGGPGVGPVCVAAHLKKYLPNHSLQPCLQDGGIGAVSAAPWGSASILLISWAYIAMMGRRGLKAATQVAILNANYIAHRLAPYYDILYKGKNGRVAHECIVDARKFKELAGITVDDIAKRLMDFGFHAPTMSWPVAGTLMIEPTESESRAELDRFCEAMIEIRQEIDQVIKGEMDREDNVLKNAPHPTHRLLKAEWPHKYSREKAAYPLPWVRARKFWPPVGRVDNAYGDKNLVCTCPAVEDYQ